MIATPHMDSLLAFGEGDVVQLQAFRRGVGGRIMSNGPVVHPNEAAIELFREMGHTLRRMDEKIDARHDTLTEKIDLARQELAEVRGAEIPESLRAVQTEQGAIKSRLDKLEEAERTRAAVARPWVGGLKEIGKALLPYAMAGALLILGLKGIKPG